MNDSFIAPAEDASTLRHPHEKVLVLAATPEFSPERLFQTGKNATSKQHVARPALLPAHHSTGRMLRSFEEPALNDPTWCPAVKLRVDGTQHPRCSIPITRLEHPSQPLGVWHLVVID